MAAPEKKPIANQIVPILRVIVITMALVMVVLAGALTYITVENRRQPPSATASEPILKSFPTDTAMISPLPPESTFTVPPPTATISELPKQKGESPESGMVVLALGEGGYSHLFSFQMDGQPLLRLTNGNWQDITPAFHPNGKLLAFASNRDGPYDLYILDFENGQTSRLTDTSQYEASPSWSPDGLWMVYESYTASAAGGDLELYIRPVDGSQEPIRLTYESGADSSPAWSPQGRMIAFVSTRSGNSEIWLADLDKTTNRFRLVSQAQDTEDSHPTWSPDGRYLVWSSNSPEKIHRLMVWDVQHPENRSVEFNNGDVAAWNPSGDSLISSIVTPNQTYLTAYTFLDGRLALPILPLPGPVEGLTWSQNSLPPKLPEGLALNAQITPTPLWNVVTNPDTSLPNGRQRLVPLPGIQGPNFMLQDKADEAFFALRERVSASAGWDFLGTLEQAFQPFTAPLSPGMVEDWLFTGRAFRFNSAPINAGWLYLVRENYGSQVYWRVYLQTRFQDGSQGAPLKQLPWLITERFSGDPIAYERGGAFARDVPSGYWLDFTQLAAAYGWERLPALSSWIRAYSAARYNEFVLTVGMDWFSAMLEIYPRALLDTPTPVPSPTLTPTATRTPTSTPTSTRTPYLSPTPTSTNTPRPTPTPRPTNTPRASSTPVPGNTPHASATPTP